jgi:hypothetical protein
MSTSLKSSLNGQGRFEIPEKFHLKIPQRGFGSFSVRNGFHKSFITNDLAWTLTWTTPEKSLCARRAFVSAPIWKTGTLASTRICPKPRLKSSVSLASSITWRIF